MRRRGGSTYGLLVSARRGEYGGVRVLGREIVGVLPAARVRVRARAARCTQHTSHTLYHDLDSRLAVDRVQLPSTRLADLDYVRVLAQEYRYILLVFCFALLLQAFI